MKNKNELFQLIKRKIKKSAFFLKKVVDIWWGVSYKPHHRRGDDNATMSGGRKAGSDESSEVIE